MTHTREAQANRVVEALSTWIQASPAERSVLIRETPEGWEAELLEKRKARGSSALDALAQVATVAEVETVEAAT